MKNFLIGLIVLVCLVLPFSANAFNNCHLLYVQILPPYYFADVSCSKGKIDVSGNISLSVMQAEGEAPRCVLTVNRRGSDQFLWRSEFEVHQNLCVFKSGNISLKHLSGPKPIATIKEGSFGHNRGAKSA